MPIRTLHDLESQQPQNANDGVANRAYIPQGLAHGVADEGPNVSLVRPPPTEPIPPIKAVLAPRFSYFSFTFFISAVQVIMFIITVIYGGVQYKAPFVKENPMLGPGTNTLCDMGGMFYPFIHDDYAVWRLLIPVLLHAGLLHIFMNLFTQMRFGFSLEKRWGMWRFIVVYFVTAIGANLLSANCEHNTVSVGASGALFGIIGAEVTYLIYNWDHTPDNSSEACILFLMGLMNMLILLDSTYAIDVYAHLGGLITGLLMAPFTLPAVTPRTYVMVYKGCGATLTVGWFLLMFLLLYLK